MLLLHVRCLFVFVLLVLKFKRIGMECDANVCKYKTLKGNLGMSGYKAIALFHVFLYVSGFAVL